MRAGRQTDDRSENGCREPSVTEATVNGMIQRVKDVLIGVRPYGVGTETVGLVQKFRLGQGAITDAEQAFLQYAPNGLGAGIRTLARYDEGMARLFVEQAALVIAVEMTQVILNDLPFAVEQAAALNEHAYAKQLQIQIAQARAQLFREYAVLIWTSAPWDDWRSRFQSCPSGRRRAPCCGRGSSRTPSTMHCWCPPTASCPVGTRSIAACCA